MFSSGGTEKAEKKEKKEKTETKKSKQKETKARTDDDLFGDTGSIFDDIPTKTKEKKKKKTDTRGDVFAASEGGKHLTSRNFDTVYIFVDTFTSMNLPN